MPCAMSAVGIEVAEILRGEGYADTPILGTNAGKSEHVQTRIGVFDAYVDALDSTMGIIERAGRHPRRRGRRPQSTTRQLPPTSAHPTSSTGLSPATAGRPSSTAIALCPNLPRHLHQQV